MSGEVPLPQSSPSSDPALLKVTEADTRDAKAVSGIADMLLIFLSAAGTILGPLLVATVYVMATGSRAHTGSWIFQLLVCVEKRTSGAKALIDLAFTARLKPCPSFRQSLPQALRVS